MRFDVPLVFLVGAASAAGIPRPNRAGWSADRSSGNGRLLEAQKEIEELEKKLLHDVEQLEHKQQQHDWQAHHRPGPYWGPSLSWGASEPASGADSSSIPAASAAQSSSDAAITASASGSLTSSISVNVPSVSYFTSAANTTDALQSLSSVAASLSSVLSSVSSVNATVTVSTSAITSNSTTLSTAAPYANTSYPGVPGAGYSTPTTPVSSTSDLPTDSSATSAVESGPATFIPGFSYGSADGSLTTSVETLTVSGTVYATTTIVATVSSAATDGTSAAQSYTGAPASSASQEPSEVSSAAQSSSAVQGSSVAQSHSAAQSSGTAGSSVTSIDSVSSAPATVVIPATSVAYPYANSSAAYPYGTAAGSGSVSVDSTTTLSAGTAISSPIYSINSTTVAPTGTAVTIPIVSANSSSTASFGTAVSTPIVSANITSSLPLGTATSKPFDAGNSTRISATGTGSSTSMAPTASVSVAANTTSATYCQNLCASLALDTEYNSVPISCEAISANTEYTFTGGQATAGCGSTSKTSFTPSVDICRVTLSITTSGESETFAEVWLPNNSTSAWNGRTLSTDNGGANGCVHYVDMQYVTSLGFAAIGDNGGHNSSAFDAGWMYFQNEVILDWVYRARHASLEAGKQIVDQFYGEKPSYSYYVGCSTGGQQGMHAAQYYPNDFDGIIAGSAAADMNHLQGWSGRFVQLTGTNASDPKFLTLDEWTLVQSYIFDQCDEALDGVNDGILEDPTICQFDASAIPICNDTVTDSCLTSTQLNTVEQVFTELYNEDGELLYPALLYGSQVDAFRLGQLSGSVQAISSKWYGGAVHNDSNYDALNMDQSDYALADSLDELHGYVSSFDGDLSGFQAAGGKLLMYHGLADPLVSGGNSQRYYLKVANALGTDNTGLDPFFRLFRISGMAHCGVGGISGAGAWMFGQNAAAAVEGVSENIISTLVDWVENDNAPDTIAGTKLWYDTPADGVDFRRNHCRFPYRTTYSGSGDSTDPANWGCTFINDWQTCGVDAHPRLCNADGTFT